MSFYRTKTGDKRSYREIAIAIRIAHPHLIGAHISVQAEALGLLDELEAGETPYMLPYSFSDYDDNAAIQS